MGLVKGVKNVFGRKQRKARRAAQRDMDALQDPMNDHLWQHNPLADNDNPGPQVNPLYDPNAAAAHAAAAAPPNAYAAEAAHKAATTGRGKGKARLKDRHVGEFKQAADDVNASAHEVRRVDYKREIGTSGTNEGFFKPVDEDTFHGSDAAERTGVGVYDQQNGDAVIERPNLVARSVANTRLDERLGLNTIAHEHEAKHNGEIGVVSAKSAGVAAQETDDIDYANPETQRSLSNIQVFDYLTNQQDRHGGNIYIDPQTGIAKGIDNDLSFGKTLGRDTDRFHGLPSQIDPAMAQQIQGMSGRELSKLVGGKRGDYQRLSQEERDAAEARLATLQAHIAETNEDGSSKHVVDQWNDETFQASLTESAEDANAASYALTGWDAKSITARLHNQQEFRRNNA